MQNLTAILLAIVFISAACGPAPECVEDRDCDEGLGSCQVGSCSEGGECVYSASADEACQPQSEPYVDLPRSDDELPPSPVPRLLSPGEAYDRPPHSPPPPPPPGGDDPTPPDPIIPRPEPPSPCGPMAAGTDGFCG